MVSNHLRHITHILYDLKHRFNHTVVLRKMDSAPTFDPETGVQTSSNTDHTIKKVIVLPLDSKREFEYDITYLAAGNNFTYGALYDSTHTVFIFTKRQLRDSDNSTYYTITQADRLILSGDIYEIKSISKMIGNLGYLVIAKHSNVDEA